MKNVESSKLKRGDVFQVVNQPEEVPGDVFWKHHKTGRIMRLKVKKIGNFFNPIKDLNSLHFFQIKFPGFKVKIIATYQPQKKGDRFQLAS